MQELEPAIKTKVAVAVWEYYADCYLQNPGLQFPCADVWIIN